jgi:hypothetical protein
MDEQSNGPTQPIFDPNKSYIWQSDESLEIKGIELDTLKKTIELALNSYDNVKEIVNLYESLKITNEMIKRGVENGKIVEASSPPQENT